MSWLVGLPNGNSSRFKLKRSHSPDPLGVNNYKKQRLIQDFEKLSLKDGPREISRTAVDDGGCINGAELNVISLPNGIKRQLWKLRGGNESENYNDGKLIYEKVMQAIRDERLQLIHWHNPLHISYWQWVEWIEASWSLPPYHDDDYNDNDNYNRNYNILGCDSDVDMDR